MAVLLSHLQNRKTNMKKNGDFAERIVMWYFCHTAHPQNTRSASPRVCSSQLLFGGEELNAVLQLEEALLLGLVLHTLVLIKVLRRKQSSISNLTTPTTLDGKRERFTSATDSMKYFLFVSGSQSKER